MNELTTLSIDIGSSTIDAVIATKNNNGDIEILGSGISKSEGLHKGAISNIELVGNSIKKAVNRAKSISGEDLRSATVSVSSSYTKIIRSIGSIIIPNGYITEPDIKKVIEVAYHNTNMIPEYEVIHVLPIHFKIDDVLSYSPCNMTGSRLEVSASIVIAKKSALVNIANALNASSLVVKNYVLSGYSSSISTLKPDEKEHGSFIMDMGANSINMSLFSGKAILYNDFLPIGSQHITNDISKTFNTPIIAAEMIKNQYGTLLPFKADDPMLQKRIKMPISGNDSQTNEITLDRIQPVVQARVEESLVLAYKKFKQSELENKVMSGIVLTGGLSKLPGIKELTSQIFHNFTVKIGNVLNLQNEYIDLNDNTKSVIIGLILYSLDKTNNYELDSNKQLRSKNNNNHAKNINTNNINIENINNTQSKEKNEEQINSTESLVNLKQNKKNTFFSKVLSDMKDWF